MTFLILLAAGLSTGVQLRYHGTYFTLQATSAMPAVAAPLVLRQQALRST
jgi:hypothetical protein